MTSNEGDAMEWQPNSPTPVLHTSQQPSTVYAIPIGSFLANQSSISPKAPTASRSLFNTVSGNQAGPSRIKLTEETFASLPSRTGITAATQRSSILIHPSHHGEASTRSTKRFTIDPAKGKSISVRRQLPTSYEAPAPPAAASSLARAKFSPYKASASVSSSTSVGLGAARPAATPSGVLLHPGTSRPSRTSLTTSRATISAPSASLFEFNTQRPAASHQGTRIFSPPSKYYNEVAQATGGPHTVAESVQRTPVPRTTTNPPVPQSTAFIGSDNYPAVEKARTESALKAQREALVENRRRFERYVESANPLADTFQSGPKRRIPTQFVVENTIDARNGHTLPASPFGRNPKRTHEAAFEGEEGVDRQFGTPDIRLPGAYPDTPPNVISNAFPPSIGVQPDALPIGEVRRERAMFNQATDGFAVLGRFPLLATQVVYHRLRTLGTYFHKDGVLYTRTAPVILYTCRYAVATATTSKRRLVEVTQKVCRKVFTTAIHTARVISRKISRPQQLVALTEDQFLALSQHQASLLHYEQAQDVSVEMMGVSDEEYSEVSEEQGFVFREEALDLAQQTVVAPPLREKTDLIQQYHAAQTPKRLPQVTREEIDKRHDYTTLHKTGLLKSVLKKKETSSSGSRIATASLTKNVVFHQSPNTGGPVASTREFDLESSYATTESSMLSEPSDLSDSDSDIYNTVEERIATSVSESEDSFERDEEESSDLDAENEMTSGISDDQDDETILQLGSGDHVQNTRPTAEEVGYSEQLRKTIPTTSTFNEEDLLAQQLNGELCSVMIHERNEQEIIQQQLDRQLNLIANDDFIEVPDLPTVEAPVDMPSSPANLVLGTSVVSDPVVIPDTDAQSSLSIPILKESTRKSNRNKQKRPTFHPIQQDSLEDALHLAWQDENIQPSNSAVPSLDNDLDISLSLNSSPSATVSTPTSRMAGDSNKTFQVAAADIGSTEQLVAITKDIEISSPTAAGHCSTDDESPIPQALAKPRRLRAGSSPSARRISTQDLIKQAEENAKATKAQLEFEEAQNARVEAEKIAREAAKLEARRERRSYRVAPSERQIVPLPQEWEVRLATIMAGSSRGKELAHTTEGTALTRKDFGTLVPGAGDARHGWLNDDIVIASLKQTTEFALKQLGHKRGETPKYFAHNSGFWTNLSNPAKGYDSVARWGTRKKIGKDHLLGVDYLFLPINESSHWTLMVVMPSARRVEYFDSFGGSGADKLALIKMWLQMELKENWVEAEWTFRKGISPVQTNSSDCGVFVCTTARMIMQGLDPELAYGQTDLQLQRRRIACELINGELGGEFAPKEFGWPGLDVKGIGRDGRQGRA